MTEEQILKYFQKIIGTGEISMDTMNKIIDDISKKINIGNDEIYKIIKRKIKQSKVSGMYYLVKHRKV